MIFLGIAAVVIVWICYSCCIAAGQADEVGGMK